MTNLWKSYRRNIQHICKDLMCLSIGQVSYPLFKSATWHIFVCRWFYRPDYGRVSTYISIQLYPYSQIWLHTICFYVCRCRALRPLTTKMNCCPNSSYW